MIVDAEGELTSAERLSYFYRGVPQESNSGTPFNSNILYLLTSHSIFLLFCDISRKQVARR